MALLRRTELTFAYDYGQVYLRDAQYAFSDGCNEYLESLDAANAALGSVGVLDGFVDVMMPTQFNFAASLAVEVHDAEPAPQLDGYDHVVEFDLALPSGVLVLEASGGGGEETVSLPAGSYRLRWSGAEMDAAASDEGPPEERGPDRYLLEAWPAVDDTPPRELKRWDGYDARG